MRIHYNKLERILIGFGLSNLSRIKEISAYVRIYVQINLINLPLVEIELEIQGEFKELITRHCLYAVENAIIHTK